MITLRRRAMPSRVHQLPLAARGHDADVAGPDIGYQPVLDDIDLEQRIDLLYVLAARSADDETEAIASGNQQLRRDRAGKSKRARLARDGGEPALLDVVRSEQPAVVRAVHVERHEVFLIV